MFEIAVYLIWLSSPVYKRVTDEGSVLEILQYGPFELFHCFQMIKLLYLIIQEHEEKVQALSSKLLIRRFLNFVNENLHLTEPVYKAHTIERPIVSLLSPNTFS